MEFSSDFTITKLPRVNTALILNTCSIFICYIVGLGFFTSIYSLILLKKDSKLLVLNPNVTNKKGYKIAVITAWIILVINFIYFAFWLYLIALVGWNNITNPEVMNDPNFLKNAIRK